MSLIYNFLKLNIYIFSFNKKCLGSSSKREFCPRKLRTSVYLRVTLLIRIATLTQGACSDKIFVFKLLQSTLQNFIVILHLGAQNCIEVLVLTFAR